jgi:NADPH:quinone reductase-like Zn-dependent oxidoreductase
MKSLTRFHRPNGEELKKIIKLWEEGIVRVVVQTVMPLEDGAKAFESLADGHTKGKIVLKVSQ